MFGLSFGSFDLWMCISSAELETHSNGHVLGIGQVMVWTSHIDAEYGDLSSCILLCYLPRWSLSLLELLSLRYLLLLLYTYLIMTYFSIVLP
jgi:hypothetical protein